MTERDTLAEVLRERFKELELAHKALDLSYRRIIDAEMIDALALSDDGLIEIEAFTARFARLVDVYVQQVLRSIDEWELQEPGSLLDRIARAEKRGWVSKAADLIAARALRNRIAHEYDAEGWRQIARAAYALVPALLLAAERTLATPPRHLGN
ncbi:MAG: hypothetical protein RR101_13390 [Burkholderiaceae bacterium]